MVMRKIKDVSFTKERLLEQRDEQKNRDDELESRVQIECEVSEQLYELLVRNSQEFGKFVEFSVQLEVFSVNLKEKKFLIVTEEGCIEFASDCVTSIITESLKAYKDRVAFYEELKEKYQEKVIEKYPPDILERFYKDIEEKAKPTAVEEWLKVLTGHVIEEDKTVKEFIKKNIRVVKGVKRYIDTYPIN
jgi:serine/threonine protein phosphatase PrpC